MISICFFLLTDNCSVNNSVERGAISYSEQQVNRAFQRCMCLLHMLESPFKHLMEFVDGCKIKWTATKGELGTKIKGLNDHLSPLVNFTPIATDVPDVDSSIFSEASNRVRLHELCRAISNGRDHVHEKFEKGRYPVINTLRWLTTSERVLGLYIREEDPSDALKTMVEFTLQSYAPTHFDVFLNPGFENASFHYLSYIKRSKVNILLILFSLSLKGSFLKRRKKQFYASTSNTNLV